MTEVDADIAKLREKRSATEAAIATGAEHIAPEQQTRDRLLVLRAMGTDDPAALEAELADCEKRLAVLQRNMERDAATLPLIDQELEKLEAQRQRILRAAGTNEMRSEMEQRGDTAAEVQQGAAALVAALSKYLRQMDASQARAQRLGLNGAVQAALARRSVLSLFMSKEFRKLGLDFDRPVVGAAVNMPDLVGYEKDLRHLVLGDDDNTETAAA